MASSTDHDADGIVYEALNGFNVGVIYLIINCCMYILSFFIALLNSIVLHTMIHTRQSHDVEALSVMVASMATADLLNGICLTYSATYNLINFQIRAECIVRLSIVHAVVLASVYHLTLISLDRCFKIMKPLTHSELFTKSNAVKSCVVVWCLSFFVAFFPVMGWNLNLEASEINGNQTSDDYPECAYFAIMDPTYIRFMMSLVLVPVVLMAVIYLIIFKVARRHAKQIAAQEAASCPDQRRTKHTWKYTKTVMIIIGLYFTCWAPTGAVMILATSDYLNDYDLLTQGSYLAYASLLAFVNSVLNPVIYAIKLATVRMRFREIFCCESKKKQIEATFTDVKSQNYMTPVG